ncbi:F-box only protein 47-like [Dunckerocampus dactyliophorus]|uniref:F-box only protein 47-like n=1 Tax=Dunckerocampus dactyliophorus TaxID=161453 RepID=UPI002404EECA|nr:F-box only protein 47-like [Dunckerocampus dactyliophorus]
MVRGKARRKTASRIRPVRTITTRSQLKNSSNFFQGLPPEVFHIILDHLSILEISVFCLASKNMTSCVVNYISTLAWKSKTILQNFHNTAFPGQKCAGEHFRHLGLLFKRCTMLLPTKDRLKFILKFLQVPCFMLEECSVPNCSGLVRYGVFLQTLIAGWDEVECHRVFIFLCDVTNLLHRIQSVLTGKPGLKCFEELELRFFCRKVLLDLSPNQLDCQFWLLRLLKPWPLVHQAHLLLILYGPLLSEGSISWHDLVVRGLPQDALWDLARAILMLFNKPEVKDWTMQSTLAVLEEITAIPQPWHVENVARLLVLCGTKLCYTVLASRALCGRIKEIAKVIVYIILVCEKDGYEMTWAVKLVQQIHMGFRSAVEKFIFIHHLENMFSEVTREFYEFYVAGNHLDARDAFGTLCLLLHSNATFHAKFLHMLLK